MKIEILSATIKNFLSFGSKPITFDLSEGINLISGQNYHTKRSNGSGKSNLIESISWGLFGKTLKDLTQNEVINWKNKKKCEVSITLQRNSDVYEISRKLKPNSLKLFKNGEEVPPPANSKDLQNYIEESILGFDHKTFTSLIHCNSNNLVSVFKASKPQKRALLENLFNLFYFSKLNKNANEKIRSMKNKILEKEGVQEGNKKEITGLEEQNEKYNNDIDELKAQSISVLDDLYSELEEAKEKAKDIDIKELEKKQDDLRERRDRLNLQINKIDKSIIKIVTKQDTLKIEDLEDASSTQNEIKTLKETIKNVNLEKIGKNLSKIENKINDLLEKKSEINGKKISIENEISSLNSRFNIEGKTQCPTCGSSIDSDKIIEETNKKIEEFSNEKEVLKKRINRLNNAIYKIKNKKNSLENIKEECSQTKEKIKELDFTLNKINENERNKEKYKKYERVLSKLNSFKDKLQKTKDTVDSSFDQITEEINEAQLVLDKPKQIESKIENEKEKEKFKKSQLEKLKNYIKDNEKKKSKLRKEILEIDKEIEKYNSIIDYMNSILWLCKDENGKQYAISNIVPFLNSRTNYYLSEADIGFYVKLDSWLNPIIKGNGITNGSYDNLSAGEQKTLELAIQFAFMDVAKINATNFPSLLLLDEILDSSIDSIGIAEILRLINVKQKEDNLAIYIISHRKEISDVPADKYYTIIKENGYSKLQ